MASIGYKEPNTGFDYSLVVTGDEAFDISTANPSKAQRIDLPTSGGSIEFDGQGGAMIISSHGKKSSARAADIVRGAKAALKD